jgi:hypothetical protein
MISSYLGFARNVEEVVIEDVDVGDALGVCEVGLPSMSRLDVSTEDDEVGLNQVSRRG